MRVFGSHENWIANGTEKRVFGSHENWIGVPEVERLGLKKHPAWREQA
jgi:hypothetical protein